MPVPIQLSSARQVVSYKPSQFNMMADTATGEIVVVNTMSGSHVLFPSAYREKAQGLLGDKRIDVDETNIDLVEQLAKVGVVVPAESNERRQLRYLQAHQTSTSRKLQLIVFPTEKCNFRCVYCYEDFEKGKMPRPLRAGLTKFIAAQVPSLDSLALDWFGGEPLLAFDVMSDVLPDIRAVCAENSCRLSGHITTNGYLLSSEIAEQLLDWQVDSFQITLDGPPEEHNKRRQLHKHRVNGVGADQEHGTFDRIMENVQDLLALRRMFNLQLRTNFDLNSLEKMDAWIDTMASVVGNDPRVRVDFCPIWADPDNVEVSMAVGATKQRTYVELMAAAHARGLRSNAPGYLSLGGLVCYAAKANSFVIRSDGILNKCTVALDADYNAVGRLYEDGSVELNIDKLSKWTSSGLEEDTTCQGCALSAACQGNACPLERFENNRRPCPPPKNFPGPVLNMARV
ncbi:radical SAM protein [Asanoa sp. NPDC049518]|uniref:radical SAM/SPASM domain-containing protein n=1 Tax=unclassified Asanoa TaxID=2685164 RepID=UPI00342AEDAA